MIELIFILVLASVKALPQVQPRITGGTKAQHYYVPSFVTLQINFERYNRTCGALFVTPGDRILTAASCVSEYEFSQILIESMFQLIIFVVYTKEMLPTSSLHLGRGTTSIYMYQAALLHITPQLTRFHS